jgi:hypothetical protein
MGLETAISTSRRSVIILLSITLIAIMGIEIGPYLKTIQKESIYNTGNQNNPIEIDEPLKKTIPKLQSKILSI